MSNGKIAFSDHAWLRMDDPRNLMIITGLMTTETRLDPGRLREVIQTRLLGFDRFRQRLVPSILPWMRPVWEEDPDFDLEAHLEEVELDEPVDQRLLQDLISVVMSKPLDYRRPLWKIYLVENYGGGSALIARLHHSLADGISLVQVLLSLTSDTPESPDGAAFAASETVRTGKSGSLGSADLTLGEVRREIRRMASDPSHARTRLRQGLEFTFAVGKLVLRWPDPHTPFKGPINIEKSCAWSQPLPLDQVKQTGRKFGATINDVLISCTAGALGDYLEQRGFDPADRQIRGLIPVNLRPVDGKPDLGNQFGMLFLSLPIGIQDPVERLESVQRNMNALKSSAEPLATYGVINLLGAIPAWTEETAVGFFDSKATAVMTNVPGPRTRRYLAGAPIDMVMAWVPQSGRIGLGVSIISYNGKVWLGVATDCGLVPDPEKIVAAFEQEFDLLRKKGSERPLPSQPQNLGELLRRLDEAIEMVDELREARSTQGEA